MHRQGDDDLMKGHSPVDPKGSSLSFRKGVKADKYSFQTTVGRIHGTSMKDLTKEVNFSVLLRRDTVWKHPCEQWITDKKSSTGKVANQDCNEKEKDGSEH